MFKKKYTKWIPFGNYSYGTEHDYIVFVRKNLKTGIMQFKTVRVHSRFHWKKIFVPLNLIDTEKAWNAIINES